jgi:hypothetical protein
MKEFIQRYENRVHGVLSCLDRMLFRGYLPIMSGWQMAQFFNSRNIPFPNAQNISCRAGATSQAARKDPERRRR